MKIKEGKASLREVNRGLKMHEQQPHARAAATRKSSSHANEQQRRTSSSHTNEQQPNVVSIDAAVARADPAACGSASKSSSLQQPQ